MVGTTYGIYSLIRVSFIQSQAAISLTVIDLGQGPLANRCDIFIENYSNIANKPNYRKFGCLF